MTRPLCKRILFFTLPLLATHTPPLALAGDIQLQPGIPLKKGAVALDVGTYAIPCVADWNGDGRKDLLVGYQTDGKVALFTNAASDIAPVFSSSSILQAGGADIAHPSPGTCGAPAPFVCDYNHDGKRDLLVGDGATGYVYFYRNTSTDASPTLASRVALKVGGSTTLSVTSRATPYVYDWNGDGLSDLLCGDGDGYVWLFKNTGTEAAPVYAAGIKISAGGVTLDLGIRSVVRMCDWDGDGVNDLLCSSGSGVYWCRNTGRSHSPTNQAPAALREPDPITKKLKVINTGARMRLDVLDWNNDGVADILSGNADGTISLYEGYSFALTSLEATPGREATLRWNSATNLKYRVLYGNSLNTITNVAYTNVTSCGRTTACTNCASCAVQFYKVQIVE